MVKSKLKGNENISATQSKRTKLLVLRIRRPLKC